MKITKLLVLALLSVVTISNITPVTTQADNDDVRAQKVTNITVSDSEITVGEEFELKAILSPVYADDDDLNWKIVGKKGIIKFEDEDRDDDEAEFIAVKAGTTKVRCSINGKAKKYSKTITITVKKAPKSKQKISIVGNKTITVEIGDDFELKVKKTSNVKNKYLKWNIGNSKIVRFDLDDDYDDDDGKEVELNAIKIGKTTVTCTNSKTGQKITYTVNVVADDDYYDDDWDD